MTPRPSDRHVESRIATYTCVNRGSPYPNKSVSRSPHPPAPPYTRQKLTSVTCVYGVENQEPCAEWCAHSLLSPCFQSLLVPYPPHAFQTSPRGVSTESLQHLLPMRPPPRLHPCDLCASTFVPCDPLYTVTPCPLFVTTLLFFIS